jgi:hypothetical protein
MRSYEGGMMATFKVGQRVRINCPGVPNHGREAVIWEVIPHGKLRQLNDEIRLCPVIYRVDVVGRGRVNFRGAKWAYEPHELIPLVDGESDTWAADAVRKVTKVHVEPVVVKERA